MSRSAATLADDALFDALLPVRLQLQASTHFTPIEVARNAARLLAPTPGTIVLDVGAGAGKFCLAAALAAPHSVFVGIEWRPHLVDLASSLARELGIANVRFLCGDACELDWSRFDSFYLYNPFAELLDHAFLLDRTIELDAGRFLDCVAGVRHKLARAPVGTRVVTFHGYGAAPPLGYERSGDESTGCEPLELWIKTHAISRLLVEPDAP